MKAQGQTDIKINIFLDRRTNRRTDGPTDGQLSHR